MKLPSGNVKMLKKTDVFIKTYFLYKINSKNANNGIQFPLKVPIMQL
jgi:hypothetical protein